VSYDDQPTTVAYPMASTIYAYFRRCIEIGAVQGSLGEMELNDRIKPLVDCIHHVLAGGEVTSEMINPGSPDVYNDLTRLFHKGMEDANTINKAAGYYVSLAP
jgi:hypothetical protein